jgi:hypothetical protein
LAGADVGETNPSLEINSLPCPSAQCEVARAAAAPSAQLTQKSILATDKNAHEDSQAENLFLCELRYPDRPFRAHPVLDAVVQPTARDRYRTFRSYGATSSRRPPKR